MTRITSNIEEKTLFFTIPHDIIIIRKGII